MLYSLYFDDENDYDLKESLDIVLKMYNNHKHTSTKFTPNELYFTKDYKIFEEAKNNIKNSFKYIGKLFNLFNIKDLVLVNPKFIIKKNVLIINLDFYYLI